VQADDPARTVRAGGELGDRERRGVRGEHRVLGQQRVQLGEQRGLVLHPLGIASTTSSQSSSASNDVEVVMRPRSCSTSSGVSLPFATARPVDVVR
jgi:hypothetical protein